VKTEAYEINYEDSGAPKVLQRRVGRVELLPLLEDLVTYSMLLKDQDIEEGKKELRFCGLSDERGWEKHLHLWLKKDEAGVEQNLFVRSPHCCFVTIV
jgi:hypothetical protein